MSKQGNGSAQASSFGTGFGGLLTIVFIVLKLLNVISWSWWWVLSPIWIYFALVIAILIIAAIIVFVTSK